MNEANEEHFDGKIAQKAIIEKDGKVLLVRDPREGPEIWELPGGRMNVDEEPRAGLAREVFEELGLHCDIHEVIHLEQFWQYSEERNAFMIAYRATLKVGNEEITPAADEICEVRWMTKEEIMEVQLFPEYDRALKEYFK